MLVTGNTLLVESYRSPAQKRLVCQVAEEDVHLFERNSFTNHGRHLSPGYNVKCGSKFLFR